MWRNVVLITVLCASYEWKWLSNQSQIGSFLHDFSSQSKSSLFVCRHSSLMIFRRSLFSFPLNVFPSLSIYFQHKKRHCMSLQTPYWVKINGKWIILCHFVTDKRFKQFIFLLSYTHTRTHIQVYVFIYTEEHVPNIKGHLIITNFRLLTIFTLIITVNVVLSFSLQCLRVLQHTHVGIPLSCYRKLFFTHSYIDT